MIQSVVLDFITYNALEYIKQYNIINTYIYYTFYYVKHYIIECVATFYTSYDMPISVNE